MGSPPPLPASKRLGICFVSLIVGAAAGILWTGLGHIPNPVLPTTMMQKIMVSGAGIILTLGGIAAGIVFLVSRQRSWILSVLALGLNVTFLVLFTIQEVHWGSAFSRAFVAQVKRGMGPTTMKKRVIVAARPIQQNSAALTEAQVRTILQHWADHNLDAAYLAHGKRDPRWDADAHELFKISFASWFRWPNNAQPTGRRAVRKRLLDAGCDDPLVLLLCSNGDFPEKRREALGKAIEGLAASQYPPSLVLLARLSIYQMDTQEGKTSDEKARCLEALRLSLSQEPLSEDDYWFWDLFFENGPALEFLKANGAETCAAVDAIPGVAEWFKHRLRGEFEIAEGWRTRGNGQWNVLTALERKDFYAHFASARRELDLAWKGAPKRPTAAAGMVVVTGGLGEIEEMREWFDRAVASTFDFAPAYEAMKWGLSGGSGENEAELQFGRACAGTERYDTSVPWVLVSTCRDALWNKDAEAFFTERAPWDELKAVIEGYEERVSQKDLDYYQTAMAILARKCGHPEICWEQLSRLNFRLNRRVANEWDIDEQSWTPRTSAETGPMAEKVLAAEAAETRGDRSQALDDFRIAYESLKSGSSDPATDYVSMRIRKLEEHTALKSATWRPFMPPASLDGWMTMLGKWTVAEDGSLSGVSSEHGGPATKDDDDENDIDALIVNLQKTGPAFEIKGEFDCPMDDKSDSEAGIAFGDFVHRNDLMSIRFQHNEEGDDGVVVAQGSDDDGDFNEGPKLAKHNTFLILVTEDTVSVSVNGHDVLHESATLRRLSKPAETQLGFCSASGEKTLRFAKVEVRIPDPSSPSERPVGKDTARRDESLKPVADVTLRFDPPRGEFSSTRPDANADSSGRGLALSLR